MVKIISSLLLICGVVWTSIVAADSPEERARHAAVYVSARQYDRALEIYRELLDAQLNSWQKETVLFNIATVFLEQQRWEEAIKAFEEVPISADSSPLLRRRYDYNYAISLLGYAKTQISLYSIDDPSFADKAKQMQKTLSLAQQLLDNAYEAECDLAQLEGSTTCRVQADIGAARQRTKQLQASLNELEREGQFEDLSFGAKVSRFIVILADVNRWLEHAEAIDPTAALAEQQRLQQIEPLWKLLRADAATEYFSEDLLEARRELLGNAEERYTEGKLQLDKGNIGGARENLLMSSEWLRGVLDLSAGDELETLFRMKLMAERLGHASPNFIKALDILTQKWMKSQIPTLQADPALIDALEASVDDPDQALLLYRIAAKRFGAITADLLLSNPLDPAAARQALQTIARYAGRKQTAMQQKTLQQAINAPPDQTRSTLEAFALAWDLSGFLQETMGLLLENYQLAVAHRRLSNDQFQRLGQQLDQLKRLIELPEVAKMAGASAPFITENIGYALADQSWGSKALVAEQPAIARLFFGEVAYWLGAVVRRSLVPSRPEQLLMMSIGEEQHAMQVVSAVMGLPEEQRQAQSGYAVPLHEAMRLAQNQPMIWAAPFVGAVLARQRSAYAGETCQRYPWDEVLPLYFLGEAASDKATNLLAQATTSLSAVLSDQKVAYRKWLKALEMLQEGKGKVAVNQQATKESEESQSKGASSSGVQMPSNSIDDILRQLQQMDREDRTEGETQQSVRGGGGKPW